jgi:hypothetical protein
VDIIGAKSLSVDATFEHQVVLYNVSIPVFAGIADWDIGILDVVPASVMAIYFLAWSPSLQWWNATGENRGKVMPSELETTVSAARVIARFRAQPWTNLTWTVAAAALILWSGVLLLRISVQRAAFFMPTSFPKLDIVAVAGCDDLNVGENRISLAQEVRRAFNTNVNSQGWITAMKRKKGRLVEVWCGKHKPMHLVFVIERET